MASTPVAANGTNTYRFVSALSIANIGHFFNMMPHDRFRASPHFAATNGTASHQNGIAYRTAASAPRLIAPVWRRGQLLRDTGRLQLQSEITLTGVMFADVILVNSDRHVLDEYALA